MQFLHKFPLLSSGQIADSPSRADGIAANIEKRRRKLAAQHMKAVSHELKMPISIWAIAVTFFNRFYARKSMKKNDPFVVACASLFLASKVENEPRPHTALASMMLKAWYGKNNPQLHALAAQSQQQQTAWRASGGSAPPPRDFFRDTYAAVLEAERVLLYTVGFDFNVDIVHTYLARLLNRPRMRAAELHKNTRFQQYCVGVANDAYEKDGTLLLQYPVDKVAVATFYFVFKMYKSKKLEVPQPEPAAGGAPWYTEEGLTPDECVAITDRLSAIYESSLSHKRKAAAPAPSAAATGASTALLGACESAAYSGGGTTMGFALGSASDLGDSTSVLRPLASDLASDSLAASKRAVAAPDQTSAHVGVAGPAAEPANGHLAKRARAGEPVSSATHHAADGTMRPPPSRHALQSPQSTDQPSSATPAAAPPPPRPAAPSTATPAEDSDKEEGELEEGELA